ncbi:MAG: translation initiation factor IF-2, partial [Candidatus Altarchaeaceae archaeon]
FMKGFVFRNSKPAIIGVRVLVGEIRKNMRLINENGKIVGKIEGIEIDKEHSIESAKKGDEVAIAIDKGVVGRNIEEGDILYTFLSYEEISLINEMLLDEEEREVLRYIREIKMKESE